METRNRLAASRDEGRGQYWRKEVTSTRQRTCMNDPWTWTTVWGLTMRVGGGIGRGRQRWKNWNNCNRITVKNYMNSGFSDYKVMFSPFC